MSDNSESVIENLLKDEHRMNEEKLVSTLNFLGFEVVDENGNLLGTDVTKFPDLMKRCAIAAATIRTGKHYYIKEDDTE